MLDMDGDGDGNADVGISDVFEAVSLIVGVGSEDSEKLLAEGCVVVDGDIDSDGDIDGASELFPSLVVIFDIAEGAKEGTSDTEDPCRGSRDR